MTKESFKAKYTRFNKRYLKRYEEGLDVTKAKSLANKAAQSYEEGDYEKAEKSIDRAWKVLKKTENPPKEIKKTIIPPLIIATLITAAGFMVWQSLPQEIKYTTYTSPENISVTYSKGWVIQNQSLSENYDEGSISRIIFRHRDHPDLQLSITGGITYNDLNTTAENAVEGYYEDITAEINPEKERPTLEEEPYTQPRLHRIYSRPLTLMDGAEAHEVESALIAGDEVIYRIKTIAVLKNRSICFITYSGPAKQYTRYANEAEECINSLKM
ncbi:MAG: hypothetical protein JW724_05720 [Candidatus Altiarchaeota archaeon]|nr:hypothetical protein [Candidatus Altiarchaeota archaeon]